MNIGFRMRVRRQQQRLALREVARRTGLSVSFLSQVERDLATPSISSLKEIAAALNTKVADLLSDPSDGERVVLRRADRLVWSLSRIQFEFLANWGNRKMEPMLITYEPGADSGDHPLTHAGEEFGIILRGTAEYWIGEELVVLNEGDCLYFSSEIPHRMRNAGETECTCLWVVTPPTL